ncbi:DALR anticodon binding domain protein [Staphylothermus marinus F1]|uniref:arginine--tRNA ligase n=1 Tax=Staphylothermus marinus (strain ATCC 43588 / DSM 3639 / JCM 9404 / F1) TaxID=399550 RepID=A3DPW2_STAMF|nr:arginine--tRNA ligase [Staphylothermus marinus]ABN70672.1 DALR anticodon binding domain protein [Staphylothermus marinus F1]
MIQSYIGVSDCLENILVEALSSVLGEDEKVVREYFSSKRIKITKTPDPKLGDYGLALHYLFHKYRISRDDWENIASRIINYLESRGLLGKCYASRAEYVNGYINFYIDYNLMKDIIFENYLSKKIFDQIKSFGKGEKIVVEHTSANPVHPLHVGSGRNAVIGNTYANLLRYLGFNVEERFYVNDMGRQVAVLVYGYRIVKNEKLVPPPNMKIDHWIGAIYALTNILIHKLVVEREIHVLEEKLRGELETILRETEKFMENNNLYPLVELSITIENLLKKYRIKHYIGEIITESIKSIEKIVKILSSKGYKHISKYYEEKHDELKKYEKKYKDLLMEQNEYSDSENKFAETYPELYVALKKNITDPDKAEEEIRKYMKKYEEGDEEVGVLFREVSEQTLKGFRETLSRLGIVFDSYDWESSHIIRELAWNVIRESEKLPYSSREEGALIIDLDKAAEEHLFIKKLFGKDQPGKLVVQRSDGTSLYTTRDIAYSIYKFKYLGASKVYNVIAVEQTREQKQVKATLYLLGYRDEAEKLVHFTYEMVNLKGMRMSGRRGQYYSLDELLEDYVKAIAKSYVESQIKRIGGLESSIPINLDELKKVFEKLAVADSRALLLSIDPSKVLTFDHRRLEEYNMGSWILYTFVRLQGILRKWLGVEPLTNIDKLLVEANKLYNTLKNKEIDLNLLERNILENLLEYPSILYKSYSELKPNKLLEYTSNLCMNINKLYETVPVLGEKDQYKRSFRILLVIVTTLILKDLVEIMGFPTITKI